MESLSTRSEPNSAHCCCVLCSAIIPEGELGRLTLTRLVGKSKTKILISALCKILDLPVEPWYDLLLFGNTTSSDKQMNPDPQLFYCEDCIEVLKDVQVTWTKLEQIQSKITAIRGLLEEKLVKAVGADRHARNSEVEVVEDQIIEDDGRKTHNGYSMTLYQVRKQLIHALKLRTIQPKGMNEDADTKFLKTPAPILQDKDGKIFARKSAPPVRNLDLNQNSSNRAYSEFVDAKINSKLEVRLENIKFEQPEADVLPLSLEAILNEFTAHAQGDGAVIVENPNASIWNAGEAEYDPDPPWSPSAVSEVDDHVQPSNEIEKPRVKRRRLRRKRVLTAEAAHKLITQIQAGKRLLRINLKRVRWEASEWRWIIPRFRLPLPSHLKKKNKLRKPIVQKPVKETCNTDNKVKKTRKRKVKLISECVEVFTCTHSTCGLRFDTEIRRDAHVLRKHEGDERPFKCRICGDGFLKGENMEAHEKTHGVETFVCEHCGKRFYDEELLNKHYAFHTHTTEYAEAIKYNCSICNKQVLARKALREHMKIHADVKSFLCEICSTSFLRKAELLNHQRRLHPDVYDVSNLPEFRCKICSKLFYSKFYVRRHEKLHTGENVPYHCQICLFKCFGKDRYEKHMATHKNERLFRCTREGCKAKYNSKAQLVIHTRIHTGERPYPCKLCGKAFRTCTALTYHDMALHKDSKHIKCEICGEGFPLRKYMMRHVAKHKSGKIPYPLGYNNVLNTTGPEVVAKNGIIQQNEDESIDNLTTCYPPNPPEDMTLQVPV